MSRMCRNLALVLVLTASSLLALPLAAQRPRGGEIAVKNLSAGSYQSPQAAMAPNGDFIVVWQTGFLYPPGGETPRVWFRLFRADGTAKTKQLRVSTSPAGEISPRLAMGADGSFIVVWQGGNSLEDTSVFGRRFNANGKPRGGRFLLSSEKQRSQSEPAVALAPDGSFVAAWRFGDPFFIADPGDVYARRFDAAGQPLGPHFLVNTTTFDEQFSPQVAMNASGDFVIGWVSQNGEGSFLDIMARRFARDGTPKGDDFRVNTDDEHSTSASQDAFALGLEEDGSFVVIWTDRLASILPNDQERPNGFFGQRYAASDEPIGLPFDVNSSQEKVRQNPALAMAADGSFFAVWTSGVPALWPNSTFIAGRRFARDATPLSSDLRIDLSPAGAKGAPAVALSGDGRGVVVWPQGNGIFARRLVP